MAEKTNTQCAAETQTGHPRTPICHVSKGRKHKSATLKHVFREAAQAAESKGPARIIRSQEVPWQTAPMSLI